MTQLSDFFFGELQFQSRRIGEAIREIGQTREHMQIDDFRVGETLLDGVELRPGNLMRRAREFLHVFERCTFFLVVTRVIAGFQSCPIFGAQSSTLRRSDVVLGEMLSPAESS